MSMQIIHISSLKDLDHDMSRTIQTKNTYYLADLDHGLVGSVDLGEAWNHAKRPQKRRVQYYQASKTSEHVAVQLSPCWARVVQLLTFLARKHTLLRQLGVLFVWLILYYNQVIRFRRVISCTI